MFARAFSNPSKAKWIIQGAGLIWFLGVFLILYSYQIDFFIAIADALIFSIGFLAGVFVLDQIFSFYIPKGGNNWLLLILPIVLSLITVLIHKYLISWSFVEQEEYLNSLKLSFYLRWAVLAMAEILVALIAIVVSKLERQEEIQKREIMMNELSKEAQLTELRQQLQPHFLFNSLNSINALVISQPQKAREMVLQLSDFLRGTIRKDSQKWVTLQEELGYLNLYLDIEKVRFGHRLEVDFSASEEAKELKIPQLLIQPLLENAIKYGLYGVTGEVLIRFSAEKKQNYLHILISNPFDPETAAPKGTGYGISSVERRLFLLFGRKDLIETTQDDLTFSVNLKIPQRNDQNYTY